MKKRGLRVIRARVTPVSRLLLRTVAEINFREKYKAAIVAVQKGGKNVNRALSAVVFEAGDGLILQASDDSPLLRLKPPTDDFYKRLEEEAAASAQKLSRPNSYKSLSNMVKFPSLSRRSSREDSQPINLDQPSDRPSPFPRNTEKLSPEKPTDDSGQFFVPAGDTDVEIVPTVQSPEEMVSWSNFVDDSCLAFNVFLSRKS